MIVSLNNNNNTVIQNYLLNVMPLIQSSVVTVGLQQVSYNIAEEGGPLSVCTVLSGTTERIVFVNLFTTDATAQGNSSIQTENVLCLYTNYIFFFPDQILMTILLLQSS